MISLSSLRINSQCRSDKIAVGVASVLGHGEAEGGDEVLKIGGVILNVFAKAVDQVAVLVYLVAQFSDALGNRRRFSSSCNAPTLAARFRFCCLPIARPNGSKLCVSRATHRQ